MYKNGMEKCSLFFHYCCVCSDGDCSIAAEMLAFIKSILAGLRILYIILSMTNSQPRISVREYNKR